MTQPATKAASDLKTAAKRKVAGLSDHDAFMHAQTIADASGSRALTPQEELEFIKCIFGPDAEFLD